ncbi:hypothetical protein [Streptomyces canus]|nr:hypothetical protein [Streptomyces canus]WSD92017.1 hypothetical protein OG925_01620 [Streptomyces canus]
MRIMLDHLGCPARKTK